MFQLGQEQQNILFEGFSQLTIESGGAFLTDQMKYIGSVFLLI